MNKPLRIALTKGRLEKDTIGLFEKIGFDCTAVREKGRKLILPVDGGRIEVVLAKANDVITYVEHGVCDMGVVGKDTIMEMQGKFFELADLGFGRCKFALATKKGEKFYGLVYPDPDKVQELGLSRTDIEAIMEQNRKDLNLIIPAYCALSGIHLVDEEFEKTPKKSIRRFKYMNYPIPE